MESMHAPEHAMSSLVVAQVNFLAVTNLVVVVANLVMVTKLVEVQVTNLIIQALLISAETIQQVAQEAQNVREAESTVLTTSTG